MQSSTNGRKRWECREQLATLTLPYHTAENVTILQEFHADLRYREHLSQALRSTMPSSEVIDLTKDDDVEVEAAKQHLHEGGTAAGYGRGTGPNSGAGATAVLVDIIATEGDETLTDGVVEKDDRRKRQRRNLELAASAGVIDL